jgi:Homeodomain-like domain
MVWKMAGTMFAAGMARPGRALAITDAQRRELRALARRPTATRREAWRAQIILHRSDGLSQAETARRAGVNRPVVALWETRFVRAGLAGLAASRSGACRLPLPDRLAQDRGTLLEERGDARR